MPSLRQSPALLLLVLGGFIRDATYAQLPSPTGLWQLNGNLNSPQAASLDASSLSAGLDYTFATDPQGYHHLQTQVFTPASKRLTVTNPAGGNGGPGATRTNQWSLVMDVKFDTLQPYAGFLQLDPANAADVTFYVFSNNNLTGSINASLSAPAAIAVNTWYRLAITCGNNSAGGGTTVKLYLNGLPNGTPRTAAFNGALSLASTFHLFSDNNAELKPAKLGSLGLWGQELTAADIATLGGPTPDGISIKLQSTIATSSPYAYAANLGWIHARPSAETGVILGEYICSGSAHSANCGWITWGNGVPANGIRYSNTDGADSGVNHDGLGNLSGLAYGANIGWINFGSNATGAPRPLSDPHRPRCDLTTGQLSGFAYGANVGWIDLATLKTSTMATEDTDSDGMADAWERERFTNLTLSNGTTDRDGDGVSDRLEYLADTDPNNPDSRLRVTSHLVSFFPNDGFNIWDVTFTSSPKRLYQLGTSPDLSPGSWYAQTGLFLGSASTSTTSLTVQPAPKDFLRVSAALPLQP